MMVAAVNTMTRPWWKGGEIRLGKSCLPVSTAALWAGSFARVPEGASRFCTGLKPSSAENSVLTGGRCPIWVATEAETPWARRPAVSVLGRVDASPAIIRLKQIQMDRDSREV